jgi:hypothetical protein
VLSGVVVGVQGLALAWRSSRDDAF